MAKMLHLSQRDARWATKTIGKTNLTLGRWGCTITCISMLSSFFGCYKSPDVIAKTPGLFTTDGLILWGGIEKLFGGKLKHVVRIGMRGKPRLDRKRIDDSLLKSPKTAVILEVANYSHWVVCVGKYGNDYYVIDPFDGKKKLALRSFGNITGSSHLIAE